MDQLERIKYYEAILNEGEEALRDFNRALDRLIALKPKIKELDNYYQGDERMKDVMDDEEGRLPLDLARGVLAEDYAYDLLMDYYDIINKLD